MPLQKNQVLTLRVERLSSDGSGVAHSPDGETVFIPGAAPGGEARGRRRRCGPQPGRRDRFCAGCRPR